ncbi:MAG: glycosyltransferase family A protein [Gordonia sp. (in: high G+C Gram-positive bacteria)]|uniref:glycosyltransferase n=1 Tax=Gordonia sp. (in: high G+C Gram-positive bacteria) TaxID=84139 RepID=UPI003BB6325E
MRISLVIPCYNEADQIRACLDAVAAQERPFDEVLVIDNNSTDETMAHVTEFAGRLPLRIVEESQQGVAWASQAGYDAAAGDVIARIDADTRLEPGWTAVVESCLVEHPEVDALGGVAWFYDSPGFNLRKAAMEGSEKFGAQVAGRQRILAGNNMVMRREAWMRAKGYVRNRPRTHEDIDVSYALAEAGCDVRKLPGMVVGLSARRFASTSTVLSDYRRAVLRTQRVHGQTKDQVFYLLGWPINVATCGIWGYYLRRKRLVESRTSPVTD